MICASCFGVFIIVFWRWLLLPAADDDVFAGFDTMMMIVDVGWRRL
jgi:hypothetical protein